MLACDYVDAVNRVTQENFVKKATKVLNALGDKQMAYCCIFCVDINTME